MSYDFLDSLSKSEQQTQHFKPPEPTHRLKQHSHKLPVSSRLFPEWAVACYAILKEKYPQLAISSMSQLIALSMQELINDNYEMVDNRLPPTEDAIDFLINGGFVNPENKRQFKGISKASQKHNEYEAQAMSSGNLKDQYEYWKSRDPEKAEEIMDEIVKQATAELSGTDEEEQKEEWEKDWSSSEEEETATGDNRNIAVPDYLDSMDEEE